MSEWNASEFTVASSSPLATPGTALASPWNQRIKTKFFFFLQEIIETHRLWKLKVHYVSHNHRDAVFLEKIIATTFFPESIGCFWGEWNRFHANVTWSQARVSVQGLRPAIAQDQTQNIKKKSAAGREDIFLNKKSAAWYQVSPAITRRPSAEPGGAPHC